MKHIYDSKLVAGKALNAKAAELGFKYSKTDKKYVENKPEVSDNAEPSK